MKTYDYDLFVIGAGSGGVRAARIAAGHGARVAICEDSRVGGTCVIRGCVPKKLMSYASHFAEEIEDAAGYGWHVDAARFSWPEFIANKDREIDRLNHIYLKLLADAEVKLYPCRGRLLDAHQVALEGLVVSAEKILLATGGWPMLPDVPGIEHAVTSNEAFHFKSLPRHITIAGGGYIAVEFAGIFNGLGSSVRQIYRGDQILRGFDPDVRNTLAAEMRKKGVEITVGQIITSIQPINDSGIDRFELKISDGSTQITDQVMYATGRNPKSADLGLEDLGVALNEKGAVLVDHDSRTNIPNVFAVGDLTDRINLTPIAIKEGHAFADSQFSEDHWMVDHNDVASAVFSQPPVAVVGLTEQKARMTYSDVRLYRSEFRPMKHTLSGRDEKTMMKLVVDGETGRVVGCHIVGMDAAEIIQGIAIAIKAGARKVDFDRTVGIHPTAAEELVTMHAEVACHHG